MSNRNPMTLAGAQKLREELHRLKFQERPRIIEAISTAREHGDLKENAEYHAAREQQSFNEGRIAEIEAVLSTVQEIDITKLAHGNRVVFGAKVTLNNLEDDSIVNYQIVGEYEADLQIGKISVTSPIAKALIGKSVDDVAVVSAPKGTVEYLISSINYE